MVHSRDRGGVVRYRLVRRGLGERAYRMRFRRSSPLRALSTFRRPSSHWEPWDGGSSEVVNGCGRGQVANCLVSWSDAVRKDLRSGVIKWENAIVRFSGPSSFGVYRKCRMGVVDAMFLDSIH